MKGKKDYQGKACKSSLLVVKLVFKPRSYKGFFWKVESEDHLDFCVE